MDDVPPRPTPFPLPSKPPTFWGFGRCQGWGRVGARAGLVLGMVTPPLPPFPWHYFLRGRAKGRGVKGGPTMPDLPRPLPRLSTPGSSPLLARLGFLASRGGGKGRYGGPTPTLPPKNLTLKTPINAPPPTHATCRAPPQKRRWAENSASSTGGGRGLGGLASPLVIMVVTDLCLC